MSKAKYKKGAQITSLDELAEQRFIYFGNQTHPVHNGWFLSWQFRYAKRCVEAGYLYRAERKDEHDDMR